MNLNFLQDKSLTQFKIDYNNMIRGELPEVHKRASRICDRILKLNRLHKKSFHFKSCMLYECIEHYRNMSPEMDTEHAERKVIQDFYVKNIFVDKYIRLFIFFKIF